MSTQQKQYSYLLANAIIKSDVSGFRDSKFASKALLRQPYFFPEWLIRPNLNMRDLCGINFVLRLMQLPYVFDPFYVLCNKRRSRDQIKLQL